MDEQVTLTRQQIDSLRKALEVDQSSADGKHNLASMSTQELIDYLITLHIPAPAKSSGQDLPTDNIVRLSRPETKTLTFGLSTFAFCE